MVPPGTYNVTMTVNGHSYSQPLTVVRDPRVNATDIDLRKQFAFELAISDEIQVIQASVERIQRLQKKKDLSFAKKKRLRTIMGDSQKDVGSLRYISAILSGLNGAVGSAPAAPSKEYVDEFKRLRDQANAVLVR